MDSATGQWYKKWWGVLVIIFLAVLGALFVASIFYVADRVLAMRNNPRLASLGEQTRYQDTEGRDNYWLGASRPMITIVEFADFACPYSKSSYPAIREIMTRYKDRVKFIYRELPIITEASLDLALASRCAGEQGLFWPMHDKLYENQQVTSQEGLVGLAEQIGADKTRFGDCLLSKKYLPKIQENLSDAQQFGIEGTPTWFVNGHKVAGDLPIELWEQIIDKFGQP